MFLWNRRCVIGRQIIGLRGCTRFNRKRLNSIIIKGTFWPPFTRHSMEPISDLLSLSLNRFEWPWCRRHGCFTLMCFGSFKSGWKYINTCNPTAMVANACSGCLPPKVKVMPWCFLFPIWKMWINKRYPHLATSSPLKPFLYTSIRMLLPRVFIHMCFPYTEYAALLLALRTPERKLYLYTLYTESHRIV